MTKRITACEDSSHRQLGVSNPYIPAEMLPDKEVSLSEVTEAIQQLQHSSVQPKTLEPSSTKLLAIEEKSVTESADEPQENGGDQKENTSDRQARLKAQIERMRQRLKSGTPALVTVAKNWIKSHSDIVALVDGDIVDLMPPDP